jgi:3-oxoacyl-[acyl-carrier protein] reductase
MSAELILIAGASSDLGVALTRRVLLSSDARIIAHCHAGADRIVKDARVEAVAADFASVASVDEMARQILDRFGVPDQVVYLPGLKLRYERFAKFDLAHFDRDLDIQVRSAITLFRRLLPPMAKKPRGKIVFVLSSVTRGAPPRFMSMYSVVKHAQRGLMRALASEYASTGITINAVSPAMVETRFLDEIPGIAKEMGAAASPRGRLATPDEVVGAIQFLLSPDSDFVTGMEIPVTGGGGF